MPPARALRKPATLGGFDLPDKIGEGGMGAVWKARQKSTGQLVAVKVLSPESSRHAARIKRFEQEFQVAARLNHPNIVKGLDFGSSDGVHYLVMELVEGRSLG